MTISISQATYQQLVREAKKCDNNSSDEFDGIWHYPKPLGQGYWRTINLREGLILDIADYQLRDRLRLKTLELQHPLECTFCLSGKQQGEIARSISSISVIGNSNSTFLIVGSAGSIAETHQKKTDLV